MSPSFYKNVIFSCYQVSDLLDYIQDESGIEIEEKNYIKPSDPAYYGVDSVFKIKFSEMFSESPLSLNKDSPVISKYPEKIYLNSEAELAIENRMQNTIEFYVAVDKFKGRHWYSSFLSVDGIYPFDSSQIRELKPGQKLLERVFETGGRWQNRASEFFDGFETHGRFVVYYREKGSAKFESCSTKAIPVFQCSK